MDAEPPEILYHYTSTEALLQIVKKREIWLSSMSQSNDSLEGKWASKVISDMTENMSLPGKRSWILNEVQKLQNRTDAIALSLSKEPDQLSQWRGYASDGSGVCIGFYSQKLPVVKAENPSNERLDIDEVLYEPNRQKQALEIALGNLEKSVSWHGKRKKYYVRNKQTHKEAMLELFRRVFVLKNDAFKEENEWRLNWVFDKQFWGIMKFRNSGGRMVPYLPVKLFDVDQAGGSTEISEPTRDDLEDRNWPIATVTLGPLNPTEGAVVEAFLRSNGLGHLKVGRSTASLR